LQRQVVPRAAFSAVAAAKVLDAISYQITRIPEGIKQLTSLQRLTLSTNQV